MIELKVHCDCGQKFKFDVEPVDGKMPFAVACPICKRDGTAKANVLLQQMSIFKMVEPAPASASVAPPPPPPPAHAQMRVSLAPSAPPAAPAPPPVAPGPIAPPPPAGPSKLRINSAAHAESSTAPASAIAPAAPPPLQTALRSVPQNAKESTGEPKLGLGILGAFLGAGVGVGAMYGFFILVGFRFPLLGVGVGILTGLGGKLLYKGTSNSMGIISGGIALVSVVGTLFLMYGDFPLLSIISVFVSVSMAYKIAGA